MRGFIPDMRKLAASSLSVDDAATHQGLQCGARDVQFAKGFDRGALVLLIAQVGDDLLLVGVEFTFDIVSKLRSARCGWRRARR